MANVKEIHRPPSPWQALAVFALSLVFAMGASTLLAVTADSAGWCCVHGWALAHGTGLVVLLLFGLLGFHVVRAVGQRLGLITPVARSSWLPHLAYISGALATLMYTEHFMWVGLVAGGVVVWQRVNGRAVRPFGLALIGLVFSVLAAADWLSGL